MSIIPNDGRMKPIVILPPDAVSAEDIKALRENGICAIECKDPAAVKFLDPIPSMASRTAIEDAAIKLSRRMFNKEWIERRVRDTGSLTRLDICELYTDLLIEGTPLDPKPTKAEEEKEFFDEMKCDELDKIAREEARAEAAERKAAKAAAKAAAKK